ncbi:hypothetical protein BamIOP4010DRAFT_0512 [Burkholderia ambifaria IOP40-10]|jgi:hypothetical protein|uniref:Integrase catalytic domain-containing protein n=1 Tax=Burkholderia ambifaria IOP40-10 TaxID=396596 RepID=B1F903_9BURK|nr:hypothetical protein BamIOP4010DRAFT_0512 [Burkholderia ambifaria IOP40-10]
MLHVSPQKSFATREQACLAISKYIEIFYNRQRTQACLNSRSPVAFTQRFYLNRIAAYPVGLHEFRPTSLNAQLGGGEHKPRTAS